MNTHNQANENKMETSALLPFFEMHLDYIFVLQASDQVIYVNPQVKRLFGVQEKDILSQKFWQLAPLGLKLISVATSGLRNERKGVTSWHVYSEVVDKWFVMHSYPIDKNHTVIMLTDITKEMKLQKCVEERYGDLHTYLNLTADTIFEANDLMNEVKAIKQKDNLTEQFFEDENVGISNKEWIREFVHPRERLHIEEQFATVLRNTIPLHVEFRLKVTSDKYIWIQLNMVPIKNKQGKLLKWLGTATDISLHKQLENEELEKEQEYLQILDSPTTGFYIRDYEKEEMSISDKLSRKFGLDHLSKKELFAHRYGLIHPEDVEYVQVYFEHIIRHKSERFSIEYRVKTIEDNYLWILGKGKIKYNEAGKPIKMYGIHIDMTEKRRAETALLKSKQQGRRLKKKLSAANELKNHYLGTLAHELRNPLAVISASVSLLEKANKDYEKMGFTIDIIKRQTNHLIQFTDDLLQNEQFIQEDIQLDKESLPLATLIEEVVENWRQAYREADLHLLTKNVECGLLIEVDVSRMKQVFHKLLSNALKFTAAGGSVSIHVRKDETNKEVQIDIIDTGIGMVQSPSVDIFEPFVQIDNSLTRQTSGLGLGLSIVKETLSLHGGRVTFESPGWQEGTTFTVTLPYR